MDIAGDGSKQRAEAAWCGWGFVELFACLTLQVHTVL